MESDWLIIRFWINYFEWEQSQGKTETVVCELCFVRNSKLQMYLYSVLKLLTILNVTLCLFFMIVKEMIIIYLIIFYVIKEKKNSVKSCFLSSFHFSSQRNFLLEEKHSYVNMISHAHLYIDFCCKMHREKKCRTHT